MNDSTIDIFSTIIAGISSIIALAAAIMVYSQTRKGWYINTLSPQRLEWADNLRNAVSEFIAAVYDNQDLRSPRAKVLLYLNPKNENHTDLINIVNHICEQKNADNIDDLICTTQELLRWNWWVVKSESTISHSEEIQRDLTVKERQNRHS